MVKSLSMLFITLCAAAAAAQQPAPPKAAHDCTRPGHPGPDAREAQLDVYARKVETYKNCLRKFAADQQEVAKAATAAGNAAVKEYNDFITELNEASARGR
jgi:hypothetical protein